LTWPARVFGALIGTGRDRLAARWTDDAGLAPQPRGRPHHAIAAARANEFDLGGIFQRMVGQSSPSANCASTWCLGFAFGGKVHVRPARSILSNALNFCCSAIAALREANGGHRWRRTAEKLSKPPQVLCSCGEQHFILGAAQATQPKPVELQDALHMSKPHLDLLALAA